MKGQPHVLGIVLAGGEGKRLWPLTADRAKPAVPFGGNYRLIDFVLSNLVNAGYVRICVLTQYKSHSLDRHITTAWRLSSMLGQYITPVPAQQRLGPRWFAGSADAIFQSLNLVYDDAPDYVCVFGADHIYRMDPSQMVEQHIASGVGCTVAGIRVPIGEANQFGVIETGPDGRTIAAFREKPADPVGLPDAPNQVFASMGNYVFTTKCLVDAVTADAAVEAAAHDLGASIIPALVKEGEAAVYDFADNEVPGADDRDRGYWRDVGTLDAYYDAHMDLVSAHPKFDLNNHRWPIHTSGPSLPPAKFVLDGAEGTGRVLNSMVCAGALVSGASLEGSVISPGVVVHPGATVEQSVLLHGVVVGRGAVVRNAIIDKNVNVPTGVEIGVAFDSDRDRFTVSENGIVAIGKNEKIATANNGS